MRSLTVITLLGTFMVACSSPSGSPPTESAAPAVERSDTYFEATGDVEVKVDDAEATLYKNKADIVTLHIVSTPASIRKLGQSYSANLFFSGEFEPKPGRYPVEFSYLNEKDTLGGSFITRGGMFSHDTKGEAEFLEFGEQVKVRFEFQTADKSEGKEGRRVVTVRGDAVCPRGDAI